MKKVKSTTYQQASSGGIAVATPQSIACASDGLGTINYSTDGTIIRNPSANATASSVVASYRIVKG